MNMCQIHTGCDYKGHSGRTRHVLHIDRARPFGMAVVWYYWGDSPTRHCYLYDFAKWAKEMFTP